MILFAKSISEKMMWLERLRKFVVGEAIEYVSSIETLMTKSLEGERVIMIEPSEGMVSEMPFEMFDKRVLWLFIVFDSRCGQSHTHYQHLLGDSVFVYDQALYEEAHFKEAVMKPKHRLAMENTERILIDQSPLAMEAKGLVRWAQKLKPTVKENFKIPERRLCVAFFGEAQTAYEVGAILSTAFEKEVLVMDLDRFVPTADVITGIEISTRTGYELLSEDMATGLNVLMDCAKRKSLSKGVFDRCAQPVRGLRGLKVVTGVYQLDTFEYYQDEYLKVVLEKAVRFFDYVLLKVNDMPYDVFTLQSFLMADKIVASLPLGIHHMRAYRQLKLTLAEKQGIEVDRHLWLSVGGEKLKNSEFAFYTALAGEAPLTHVPFMAQRAHNERSGKVYCHQTIDLLKEVYRPLMEALFKEVG